MPRQKSSSTKTLPSSKSKKRPAKKQTTAWPSFWQRNKAAIIFIAAFAVIGGIIMLFMTHAATSGNPITSGLSSSKCLDNASNKKVDGNKIQLWDCNSTAAQNWNVNTNGTITNSNGFCLDVKSAGTTPRTLVQLWECNGTVAQVWKVNTNGTITNPHSGLCLDDQYSNTTNGNQIWIWGCNGTNAQKWTVTSGSTSTGGGSGSGTGTGSGSTSSLEPSGQAIPGSVSGWKQVFADNFSGTVPKGAFSDCNHNTDTPQAYCGGLKNYGSYYNNWWAYPNNWDDTAKSGADGNTGAPFGGTYHPEDVVSVSSGEMHINMYRPSSGGDNHVATVVPRKCMDQEYGRYVERFKVAKAVIGFKSAHLFYDNGHEMDYPESDDYTQTINAFTHPSEENFSTSAKWTDWHTTAIEWTPGSVKYYMDGKLIGTAKKNIPNFKMTWALQNESSISGPYAKAGASAQLDIDWVTCYSQS